MSAKAKVWPVVVDARDDRSMGRDRRPGLCHYGAVVERVAAAETYELRHRVLGRGRSPADVAAPDDEDPDSGHFVVRVDGEIVGTGTVRRRSLAAADPRSQWQIRGMAVLPEAQGQGLGSQVLAAILDHVGAQDGGLAWCHARIRAEGLYRRAGFTVVGEPFDDPVAGRQVLMQCDVTP